MKDSPLILAIDHGTQSVRALLFDQGGQLVGCGQVKSEAGRSNEPGWVEHEVEDYWQGVGRACRRLWREGHDPARVAGLAVTTQRGTQICLDAEGQALRSAISWVDRRRVDCRALPAMPLHWRALIAASGRTAALRHLRENAECNWLAVHEPGRWRRTAHFLGLSGYLNLRLTGRAVDSAASQVGYLPFDYRRRAWARAGSWHWHALAVCRRQLPELIDPGRPLGKLTASAAAHIGLHAGLPVMAAGADKACELLGACVGEGGTACISYGTRSTLSVHSSRYFEAIGRMPAYPAALPGGYMVEAAVPRGFWMVSWFKREFGLPEQRLAEETGTAVEALLDRLVEQAPPGSLGLVLQPYWGRDIEPGPEARGAVIGFSEEHTRAHLYRAILEGIAYALRAGSEAIERRGRRRIDRLRVVGGGAQSDAVLQITADVFGLPVERARTHEASGLGAAILAAAGLDWYADPDAAMIAMTRPGRRFEPDPDAHAVYDALHRRVYRRLYGRLAPLYRAIGEIT